jgi:hypothetical protein
MADEHEPAVRPETDDYDLLTYGEVAARMSELLASESQALEELRAGSDPDPAAIQLLELRIAQLTEGRARYQRQSVTAETFMKRFGLPPRPRG